jgi:hypothetical protein
VSGTDARHRLRAGPSQLAAAVGSSILLRRLLARLTSRTKHPVAVVPLPAPPAREGQEVWGATRPASTGGWREVGRQPGESIFG